MNSCSSSPPPGASTCLDAGAGARRRELASLLAGLGLLPLGAKAQAPAWRFAFSELPPWKFKQGEAFDGAYTAVVRELARRQGASLQFLDCPQRRCLLMLERGEADLFIGLQRTAERERFLHFLDTPYRQRSADKVFYVRRQGGVAIERYEDLKRLRIGVKNGAAYFARFDADTTLRRDAALDHASSLRKLARGRVDAVPLAEDQGEVLLAELALGEALEAATYRVPDPSPRSLAVARSSALMRQLPALEAGMRALREDGTLARLYALHFNQRFGVPLTRLRIE